MTTLAQDTFIRANQSGWGTASDGQTWVEVGGTETPSIVSNEGILTGTIGGDTVMALGSKTQADTDCIVRVKANNSGVVVPGIIFRLNALGTSYYRVKNNNALLGCTRVNAGSATAVGTAVAATFTSNTFYWLHARIVGSTITANWWADGGSEPGGWMFTAVDGTPISAAGQFGIYCNNNANATDSGTFDSFTATDTQSIRDIKTRFRLMSANQLKDVVTRFRLMSANQVKDIVSRFRLKSADQLKDISTRFILASASQRIKDIASRFRLMSANQLKDITIRFRLMSTNQVKDVASRFRLRSANQLKDISTRFRLMSANQLKDIASRFILAAANARTKDIICRFILAGGNITTTTAYGRDGKVVASSRDGLVTARGR